MHVDDRDIPGGGRYDGHDDRGMRPERPRGHEDGRDDYLCAEHYVMLGNWDRDPDRYAAMREIVRTFLRSLYGEDTAEDTIEAWMSEPENSHRLVGGGSPESSADSQAQQQRLSFWVRLLEDEQVMECIIASYHVVSLLGEYAPLVNPQQLKNAIISKTERKRVESLLEEHGKISPDALHAATSHLAGCVLFVTNDTGFRGVASLPLVILDDLLKP